MDIDSTRLRAFLHVAERGTVAAAADALGYTAPAVSMQIAKLEAQLGTAVFDRVNGRLRLSPAGERLRPLATQVLDLVDRAPSVAEGAPPTRPIVIAGFASALTEIVLPALRARDRPVVHLHEAEDGEALRELRLGSVDIAIVQEYDVVPVARDPRFAYTELVRDRLRLVAPPDVPARTGLAELAGRGWLVNGSGTRCEAATQEVLRRAGITPRITGRVADNQALLTLVAAGVGATIAPDLVVRRAHADVTVARADLGATRTIAAVTRTALADELRPLVDRLQGRRRRPVGAA